VGKKKKVKSLIMYTHLFTCTHAGGAGQKRRRVGGGNRPLGSVSNVQDKREGEEENNFFDIPLALTA